MLLDFEVGRFTRECAATGRNFRAGETFYSVLEVDGAEVRRRDFSAEAWSGPPEGVLGWWKSRVGDQRGQGVKLAPNEVLLELFDELTQQQTAEDLRYVLALLLVRRRVMRLDDADSQDPAEQVEPGTSSLNVYCPRREQSYRVHVFTPDRARIDEIQQQLAKLLYAEAA